MEFWYGFLLNFKYAISFEWKVLLSCLLCKFINSTWLRLLAKVFVNQMHSKNPVMRNTGYFDCKLKEINYLLERESR